MPDEDDRLRDRAEGALRLQRGLTEDMLRLFGAAAADKGRDYATDLGDWLCAGSS